MATTSFPYLAVARRHGVPYAQVLRLSHELDGKYPFVEPCVELWEVATHNAWQAERVRRHRGQSAA